MTLPSTRLSSKRHDNTFHTQRYIHTYVNSASNIISAELGVDGDNDTTLTSITVAPASGTEAFIDPANIYFTYRSAGALPVGANPVDVWWDADGIQRSQKQRFELLDTDTVVKQPFSWGFAGTALNQAYWATAKSTTVVVSVKARRAVAGVAQVLCGNRSIKCTVLIRDIP